MNKIYRRLSFPGLILIAGVIFGQIIKIPIGTHGGAGILDISVIILCILGLINLKFKLRKPPRFIISALFFVVVATLSLILTPLNLAPFQYFTALSYTIRFSNFILLGSLIYSGAFQTFNENIAKVLLFSGMGMAILGLLQLIFLPDLKFLSDYGWDPHYFRTVSTFLDPNFLGAYLTLTLIILYQNDLLAKKWNAIFFTLVFLGLMTTFSRGAYLGFGAGFLTLSFLNKSLKLLILTILLSILLLSSYIFYQKVVAQVRYIDRTQSAQYRLNSWEQGLSIFEKHPFLGVGFNAYRYALREYQMGNSQFLESHGASSNDSSLLYVLATTGILGFISYLFFLGSLFWTSYQKYLSKNEWGIILVAGLVTLFIQSFFSNTLFYPPLLFWLIMVASTTEKS